jgi:hypothetical protein
MGGLKILKTILLVALIIILSSNSILATNETSNESTDETMETINPTIEANIKNSEIKIDEKIEISIALNSPEKEMTKIIIDWGDTNDYNQNIPTDKNSFYLINEEHTYDENGEFTITVKIYCDGELCAETSKEIEVEEPEIIDNPPTVELISPSDKITSKQDKMNFIFKPKDDFKIENCKFELYIKENELKILDYEEHISKPEINKEIEIKLEQFEDANYSWYTTCYDNSSQKDSDSRDFTIKTVNHEREKEILSLLEKIDNFKEEEENLDLIEKKALEDLEISENLKYYKKRLLQINQDLGNNIKFIADTTLREKRKIETHQELNEIKEKIPNSIEILENEEFIKNTLTNPIDKIIKNYIESKNIILNSRKLKKLIKNNQELQEKITISTEIKQIKIIYNSSSEIITLVKKTFNTNDQDTKKILEFAPTKTNIDFKMPTGKLNNKTYEILIENLNQNEITYSIKDDVNIELIKSFDTILFNENMKTSNSITGLSILDENLNQNSIITICIILSIILALIINTKFSKNNIKKLNKNETTKKIITLLSEGNKEINKENHTKAKEKYHLIKKDFTQLTKKTKEKIFPEIEKLRIEIDKREMRDIIREYEKMKKENNIKEYSILYQKIKTKYKNLPKKYQEKIYKKLFNF